MDPAARVPPLPDARWGSTPASEDRDEVLEFLLATLPGPVERIDTHAATVLLSGRRAYKLKRPVRFSFLDFSTLELREATLRRELDLNRRTAPGIYRRVVPVTREPDGRLRIGGRGTPVEWLLEMARFPAGATLDELAARGALDLATVDRLAEVVADFHSACERRPDVGGYRPIAAVVAENRANLLDLTDGRLSREHVERLDTLTRRALDARRAVLDARAVAGRVRLCHGDLHLGNIVLVAGVPVLFDCIEFGDAYACIDVMYDLAFCVMDLLDRGLPDAAHRLLQGWVDQTGDVEALALLPAFLAIRATVRAKVRLMAAERAETDPASRLARIDEAHAYLALAERALCPAPARVVAIGGRSGTGKSAVARAVAPRLGALPGAIVVRSDVVRKALLGHALTDRLGPDAYRPGVSARVYATVRERVRAIAATGHSAIADCVYAEASEREAIAAVSRVAGARFTGVWLDAPEAVLLARIRGRRRDASDADAAVVHSQAPLADVVPADWNVLDASGPLPEVAAGLRALVTVTA